MAGSRVTVRNAVRGGISYHGVPFARARRIAADEDRHHGNVRAAGDLERPRAGTRRRPPAGERVPSGNTSIGIDCAMPIRAPGSRSRRPPAPPSRRPRGRHRRAGPVPGSARGTAAASPRRRSGRTPRTAPPRRPASGGWRPSRTAGPGVDASRPRGLKCSRPAQAHVVAQQHERALQPALARRRPLHRGRAPVTQARERQDDRRQDERAQPGAQERGARQADAREQEDTPEDRQSASRGGARALTDAGVGSRRLPSPWPPLPPSAGRRCTLALRHVQADVLSQVLHPRRVLAVDHLAGRGRSRRAGSCSRRSRCARSCAS